MAKSAREASGTSGGVDASSMPALISKFKGANSSQTSEVATALTEEAAYFGAGETSAKEPVLARLRSCPDWPYIRGNHLSNATCLTQVFFNSGE